MNKAKQKYWVGFDLGGTKMFACLFDESFNPICTRRKKTRGYEGAQAGLERMIRTIQQACDDADIPTDQLRGIGIGCPGPLDLEKGVIIHSANLGWHNVPVKQAMEDAFGCPTRLGNDVDLGVLGECSAGAGRGARCALGIFPGTGIGAGCVYEGKVITGKNTTCMEFGHIIVQPNGPRCGCGQFGCMEAVASRLAIAAEAAKAAYRGQAPHLLEDTGMNLADIRSGALKRAVDAGDTIVEQIIRDGARWLGQGVATMINLLDPDVIILGGGLVEALPEIYLSEVTATAQKFCMAGYRDSFEVRIAELGDNAGTTGSAHLIHDAVCNA